MVPPLITLEEHYISSHIGNAKSHYAGFMPAMVSKLESLSDSRLSDMDAGSVGLQVLSHGPLDADASSCRAANDELASACKSNPKRLAAFAMLPMIDPFAAAEELARCVQTHNFVGALINNHLDGTFYDDRKFWPVFAKAVELDVPIYIHPTFASDDMLEHYKGNYSDKAATMLSRAGWGWHTETGLHFLRLWTAGLFDELPKLKIVIGHMGEMLPFQLDRISGMSKAWAPDVKRDIMTVWRENMWITTSGMFTEPPLACLLRMSPIDKIMYSVDYPFSPNEKGLKFVQELEKSDLVSESDLKKICYENAEKLLKVKV